MANTLALIPIGSHISDTTISASTTLDVPSGANRLLIQALTNNVRYTLDGTTPTAAIGFRLTADEDPLLIVWTPGMTVKVIEETASASIQAQWAREG